MTSAIVAFTAAAVVPLKAGGGMITFFFISFPSYMGPAFVLSDGIMDI